MGYNGIRFPDEDSNYGSIVGHHWKLDEDTGDYTNEVSGNVAFTTLTGTTDRTAVGVRNDGFQGGDGAGALGHVRTPNVSTSTCPFDNANPTSYTMECWVYLDGYAQRFSQGGHSYVSMLLRMQAPLMFDLRWQDNTNPTTANCSLQIYHSGTTYAFSGGNPIPMTTWTHIGVTFDSTANELKLYINGSLEETVSSVTVDPATTSGQGWHSLGYLTTTNNYQTGAIIDEVAMWHNTVITDWSDGGGIQAYAMHHLNHNCNKYDLINEPTERDIITINTWRND